MRAVGEQMPRGASPRYLIEAVWGAPAPGEKRGSASSSAPPTFSAQAKGSACRQTHWGRAGVPTVDRTGQPQGLSLHFPGSTVDSAPPWDSGEKPGITQRNVPPGMKNQAWELLTAHGLWVETP